MCRIGFGDGRCRRYLPWVRLSAFCCMLREAWGIDARSRPAATPSWAPLSTRWSVCSPEGSAPGLLSLTAPFICSDDRVGRDDDALSGERCICSLRFALHRPVGWIRTRMGECPGHSSSSSLGLTCTSALIELLVRNAISRVERSVLADLTRSTGTRGPSLSRLKSLPPPSSSTTGPVPPRSTSPSGSRFGSSSSAASTLWAFATSVKPSSGASHWFPLRL